MLEHSIMNETLEEMWQILKEDTLAVDKLQKFYQLHNSYTFKMGQFIALENPSECFREWFNDGIPTATDILTVSLYPNSITQLSDGND